MARVFRALQVSNVVKKRDSFWAMSDLNSLSADAVKSFMLSKGGKVTNHELVKHFKTVLTNPETRGKHYLVLKDLKPR